MKLTFELALQAPEEYLAILEVLDAAVDAGILDAEFTIRPDLRSLQVIAEHAQRVDTRRHA